MSSQKTSQEVEHKNTQNIESNSNKRNPESPLLASKNFAIRNSANDSWFSQSDSYFLTDIDNKIAKIENKSIKNFEQEVHLMLDIDSTIYPLMDAMRLIGNCKEIVPEKIHEYSDLYRLSSAEKIYNACQITTMRQIGLMPGAFSAIKTMESHGIQLHYLTHRPECLAEETAIFLEEEGLLVNNFHCDLEINKIAYCLDNKINYIADDNPTMLDEAIKNGISSHTISWQYNRKIAETHGIPITKNWFELTQSIFQSIERDLNHSEIPQS